MARKTLHIEGDVYSAYQDSSIVVPVDGIESVTISARVGFGAAWAGTLTIEVSGDGLYWTSATYVNDNSGTPGAAAVSTITANGQVAVYKLSTSRFLRVRVSTPSGTTIIHLIIFGKGEYVETGRKTVLSPNGLVVTGGAGPGAPPGGPSDGQISVND